MSIWVLRQKLDAEQEKTIAERTDLILPFDNMPDLTQVSSPPMAMQLMAALYPGDPPEAMRHRFDRFWKLFSNMQTGDLIAVPLPLSQGIALAEISGHYHYDVGPEGSDVHLIPVRWVQSSIPLARFGKHKKIFELGGAMVEVMDAEARVAIRDKLPHSYNRFAKWKWLIVLFFLMNIIGMVRRLLN